MQNVLPCHIEDEVSSTSNNEREISQVKGIVLNNLGYSRGSAEIWIEHLVIEPGIYAVTGANGKCRIQYLDNFFIKPHITYFVF